jgi:hypothetical protein
MSKSHKRLGFVVGVVGLWIVAFWFLANRMPSSVQRRTSQDASPKKLVGSGHLVALYRVTWPSGTMPIWNAGDEHSRIMALTWKGIEEKSLRAALRDPTARVELVEEKKLQNGVELRFTEKDNAQHRLMSGGGWADPISLNQQVYSLTVSGGVAQVGAINDNWAPTGHGHTKFRPRPISPQQYVDDVHELVKLPDGKYERRVYVIAIS